MKNRTHRRPPVPVTVLAAALLAAVAACTPARPPTIEPPGPPLPPGPIAGRLAREAASRPVTALPVERVHAALVGGGIGLARWKQVLGSPVGARYCMAGVTEAGLAVSVCEYPDDDAAARGLRHSRAAFDRLIPHRDLQRNGATLLTLAPPGPSAPVTAQAQRARAIFTAL